MTLSDVGKVELRLAQIAGDAVASASSSPSTPDFVALLETLPDESRVATPREPTTVPSAKLERLIAAASAATGNDPALVKAIVANESAFDPLATSSTGAAGLMQLMPATAAENGVRDAYDPAQNVAGGTRYFAALLQRFNGDVPTALAAYNAGPEAIAGGELPAETQRYVRSVLTSYASYRGDKPSG
jgi:soluble lytic murein transglycosylase-like protein